MPFGTCAKNGGEYCFEYLDAFVCVVEPAKGVWCGGVDGSRGGALPTVKLAGSVLSGADCVRGTHGLYRSYDCGSAGGGEV